MWVRQCVTECVFLCMYLSMCVHMCVFGRVVCVCMVYVCVLFKSVCTCMYVLCMSVCTCVYVYKWMCICIGECRSVHIKGTLDPMVKRALYDISALVDSTSCLLTPMLFDNFTAYANAMFRTPEKYRFPE